MNDGGPAFPVAAPAASVGQYSIGASPGMSLRDYFAAQALAGMLGAPANVADMDCRERARYAYANADAMLAERSRPC